MKSEPAFDMSSAVQMNTGLAVVQYVFSGANEYWACSGFTKKE